MIEQRALHSTELYEEAVHHVGGFADPRPTRNDGVAGLEEVLLAHEARYRAPVTLTGTASTGTVAERIDRLDGLLQRIRKLRARGHCILGYTWWPVLDMYGWTYRHERGAGVESLLTMRHVDFVETEKGLLRRKNPAAITFLSTRPTGPPTAAKRTEDCHARHCHS